MGSYEGPKGNYEIWIVVMKWTSIKVRLRKENREENLRLGNLWLWAALGLIRKVSVPQMAGIGRLQEFLVYSCTYPLSIKLFV